MYRLLVQIISIAGIAFSSCFGGQNFVCDDPTIAAEAERARIRSATYWTGETLRTWKKPCQITLSYSNTGERSNTKFTFHNGDVFGWRIHLRAKNRAEMFEMIQHEVDHAVRYTLTRRPMVRWLDEGCATLFENENIKGSLNHQAYLVKDDRNNAWNLLDAMEYPTDNAASMVMYATGFSMTKYLIETYGKAAVLAFQKDKRKPSQKFVVFFRHTPEEVEKDWRQYIVKYQSVY